MPVQLKRRPGSKKSKPGLNGAKNVYATLLVQNYQRAQKAALKMRNATPALVVTEGAYRAKSRRIIVKFEGTFAECYAQICEMGDDNRVIVNAATLEEMDYGG